MRLIEWEIIKSIYQSAFGGLKESGTVRIQILGG